MLRGGQALAGVAPSRRRSWRARISGTTRVRRSARASTTVSRSALVNGCILQTVADGTRTMPDARARGEHVRARPALTLGCWRSQASPMCSSRRWWCRRCRPSRPTSTPQHLDDLGLHRLPAHLGGGHAAAGQAGRHYGKKRLLVIAMLIFAVGTVAAALAGSIALLIAARALQGAQAPSSRCPSGSSATSSRPIAWAWASGCCRPPSAWAGARARAERGDPDQPAVDLALLDRRRPGLRGPGPGLEARPRVADADAVADRLARRGHPVGRPLALLRDPQRGRELGLAERDDPRPGRGLDRHPRPLGGRGAARARADGSDRDDAGPRPSSGPTSSR